MAAKSRARALLILLTAFSGLALAGVALVLVVRSLLFGDPLAQIEKRLPKQTPVLLAVRELDELASVLDGISGGRIPSQLMELRTRFRDVAGFDPLDRDGWVKSGLEVDRPWVIAGKGRSDLGEGTLFLLVPVRDEEAALATVRNALEQPGRGRIEARGTAARTLYVVTDSSGQKSAFTFDAGYLLAATIGDEEDAERVLAMLFDRREADSLAAREEYRALKRNVEGGWHLFGYAAPELVDEEQDELRRRALTRGLAGTVHVSNERLRGRLASLQDSEGRAARIWRRGSDGLSERISGSALAAVRASLDLKELYAVATRGNEDDVREKEDELRARYGLDVRKELIDNFAGHFTLAVLEPSGSSLLPVDGVFHAQVNDAELAIATVRKLVKPLQGLGGLKENGTGAERWFESSFGAVGVTRGHLVAAAGATRVTAVKESLEKGGSFLDGIPAEQRRELTGGAPAYAWIDLAKTSKLATENAMAKRTAGELVSAAGALSGLWAGIDTSKEAVLFDVELIAAPGGFRKVLEALPAGVGTAAVEPTAPASGLDAEADVMEISGRDGVTTALMVRNVGDTEWSGVRLQVDDRYTAEVDAVPAGGRVVLGLDKFKDADGERPNPDMAVRKLRIEAAQGLRELPLR